MNSSKIPGDLLSFSFLFPGAQRSATSPPFAAAVGRRGGRRRAMPWDNVCLPDKTTLLLCDSGRPRQLSASLAKGARQEVGIAPLGRVIISNAPPVGGLIPPEYHHPGVHLSGPEKSQKSTRIA